ncbi:hypothetical protein HanXRQr2_Chr02g0066371 [Helianthus annuus]|uniref:Uncharacterized protein n=1 Tax=Helianthus annuus TaxID=4232 RepID=A0A9K3JNW2_HELAN|nr:hypothetical protein HanXRQr2_Chr02g0066371 [Helianthus annuus]KAJ0951852.1 hypothetical protein HanPSC8_Chr02g0065261 [Helianthus annuus]
MRLIAAVVTFSDTIWCRIRAYKEKVHLKMILRKKKRMSNSWILMLGVMKRIIIVDLAYEGKETEDEIRNVTTIDIEGDPHDTLP